MLLCSRLPSRSRFLSLAPDALGSYPPSLALTFVPSPTDHILLLYFPSSPSPLPSPALTAATTAHGPATPASVCDSPSPSPFPPKFLTGVVVLAGANHIMDANPAAVWSFHLAFTLDSFLTSALTHACALGRSPPSPHPPSPTDHIPLLLNPDAAHPHLRPPSLSAASSLDTGPDLTSVVGVSHLKCLPRAPTSFLVTIFPSSAWGR